MYSLAHRPWHVFCRISLQHRSSLSHRSPRFPQLCYGEPAPVLILSGSPAALTFAVAPRVGLAGWQSATTSIHSWRLTPPDCRVSSAGLGRIQHYSTSGDGKDPPKAQSAEAPSADKPPSGDLKATPSSSSGT